MFSRGIFSRAELLDCAIGNLEVIGVLLSAVIGMSLCRVHLYNLPCVYTLLRLISNARYVSKNMLSRDKI